MEGEIFKELEINVENENAEGEKPNLNFLINTYTDYAYTINDILKDYENIKNEKFIQEIKKVFPERCINSSLLEKVDLPMVEKPKKSMVEKATDYIFNIFTRTQNKEENIGQ
uniref:Uncharacterized protein n=1 Tax=Meloidogyne hapla TaxID=6305 RepID=A0A1I8C205_MELHA